MRRYIGLLGLLRQTIKFIQSTFGVNANLVFSQISTAPRYPL